MEEKKELYLQQQIDLLTLQLEESKYKEESLKQMNSNLAQVIIQHSDPQGSSQLEGQINIQLLRAVEQLEIELNQNKERSKNQLQAYQNRAKDLERQIQSITQKYLVKKEKNNQRVKELNNQILLLEKEKLTQMLQKQQLKEQYQDEIKELQCLIKQSQEKQIEYEQNIQKLKDDLQKQNFDNLEKIKKIHEQEKKTLNSKIQEYQTNNELKNQQNKQNTIQNYIQQIELLKNEIYLKNMSLVRMNKKFSQFQEEIDEINTKYQEQTKSSLTKKIEYETNIQELQSQIWRLKKYKNEIVEQRDKLQAQVLFLNQSINNQSSTAYKELLAMKDQEIQEIKKSFKQKQKQIKLTNHKKLEESQKNNENLQKQICKDLQIIVEKEQTIQGLKNEISKLKINVLEHNTHDQTILDKIKESIQQKLNQDQIENQNLNSIFQNRSTFEKFYRNKFNASQERHPNTLRFINTKEEILKNQTPTQKENTKKRKINHYEFSFTAREGPQNNQKQQKQNLRYQNKSARSKSIISSDMEDESLSCRSYNLVLQSEWEFSQRSEIRNGAEKQLIILVQNSNEILDHLKEKSNSINQQFQFMTNQLNQQFSMQNNEIRNIKCQFCQTKLTKSEISSHVLNCKVGGFNKQPQNAYQQQHLTENSYLETLSQLETLPKEDTFWKQIANQQVTENPKQQVKRTDQESNQQQITDVSNEANINWTQDLSPLVYSNDGQQDLFVEVLRLQTHVEKITNELKQMKSKQHETEKQAEEEKLALKTEIKFLKSLNQISIANSPYADSPNYASPKKSTPIELSPRKSLSETMSKQFSPKSEIFSTIKSEIFMEEQLPPINLDLQQLNNGGFRSRVFQKSYSSVQKYPESKAFEFEYQREFDENYKDYLQENTYKNKSMNWSLLSTKELNHTNFKLNQTQIVPLEKLSLKQEFVKLKKLQGDQPPSVSYNPKQKNDGSTYNMTIDTLYTE